MIKPLVLHNILWRYGNQIFYPCLCTLYFTRGTDRVYSNCYRILFTIKSLTFIHGRKIKHRTSVLPFDFSCKCHFNRQRHLRAIEPHTKIHLIKEALLSCIIGHCMRKGKTDNSNLKTTTKTTETNEISIRMRKQFKLSIVLYK